MRHLFDIVDSGAYDIPIFIAALSLFVITAVWLKITTKRNEREFFAARDRAQKTFEERGAQDELTQLHIMDALGKWQVWQRRHFALVDADNPTETEWHALSLYNALPRPEPNEMVM